MVKTLLFILMLCPLFCQAQQRAQYSLYMVGNYVLNPALTGIEDYTDVKLGHRSQWVGIEGAPNTTYIYLHMPIGNAAADNSSPSTIQKRQKRISQSANYNKYRNKFSHHGFGGMVSTDKIGPFRQTEFLLSYAYHIKLSPSLNLSQGASLGMIQYSLNNDLLNLERSDDPNIGTGTIHRYTPDLTVGLWMYSSRFFLGVSGTQLFGERIALDNGNIQNRSKVDRHYFLTTGYKIISSQDWSIIPSLMVKYIYPAPVSVDLNLRAIYNSRYWAGVSFRSLNSFNLMAGISMNHFLDLSYGYDTSINGLRGTNSGSHEVIIGFKFKNKNKVLCPQNMW